MEGFAACRWPGGHSACLKRCNTSTRLNISGLSTQGTNMVVIRLSRGGSKARPFYNIVVADKRTRRDGKFIERVGFYNPIASANEEGLRIVADRMTYWKSVGAQASPTVERLINQAKAKA
jgi:small subunit ribosomal protein S16